MAGGKGQVKRRTTNSAAAIGEGTPMKGFSTKAKGAPTRRPLKECGPRVKAEEEALAARVAVGEEEAGDKKQMPESHVKWILAKKPMAPPARFAALKERNPDLKPLPEEEADEDLKRLYFLAKAFYDMEERMPKKQEWVREQLRTKGYVEVDDEWLKQRAEAHAVFDREWPKIQAKLDAMMLEDKEYARLHGVDENDCSEEEED
ncbi:hypothetical protein EJB05_26840, partial [Eragrostis curvula]